MPVGILFWVLLILTVLAYFFATGYPLVSFGCLLVLLGLVGWKLFGPPLQ